MLVRLADDGLELIRKLFPAHAAVIASEMSVLSESEQDTLAQLCRKLGLKNNK